MGVREQGKGARLQMRKDAAARAHTNKHGARCAARGREIGTGIVSGYTPRSTGEFTWPWASTASGLAQTSKRASSTCLSRTHTRRMTFEFAVRDCKLRRAVDGMRAA